jgi:hypothetical protein
MNRLLSQLKVESCSYLLKLIEAFFLQRIKKSACIAEKKHIKSDLWLGIILSH